MALTKSLENLSLGGVAAVYPQVQRPKHLRPEQRPGVMHVAMAGKDAQEVSYSTERRSEHLPRTLQVC